MSNTETIKTPYKSEINIKCRGKSCREIHHFINEMPIELVCKCGYVIAKNGVIWPTKIANV